MPYELPKLPYPTDALEPYIDKLTMEIHHDKHHKAYVDKLNAALEKYPKLQRKPVEELLKDLNAIPEDIRAPIRNHGGGHYNHSFFWLLLKKDIKPEGDILKAINSKFGNFEEFRKQFSTAALSIFGSGWAWLVIYEGSLEIITTPNQDTPLSQGKIPVLGIDIWEHSYYLRYQNRRNEYVEAFFNVINWKQVNENFKRVK
jgi:superoxide dismutase, Fe-Mn family